MICLRVKQQGIFLLTQQLQGGVGGGETQGWGLRETDWSRGGGPLIQKETQSRLLTGAVGIGNRVLTFCPASPPYLELLT